jgi:hypothetical protein
VICHHSLSVSVIDICVDLGTNPPSDMPMLSFIAASIVVNSVIFYLLPSSISPLNKSYIVSTIHACVSVLSVTFFFAYSGTHFDEVNRMAGGGLQGTIDELMPYSLCYSAGYFLYDMIIMFLYDSVRNRSALVHHTVIVVSVLLGRLIRVCVFSLSLYPWIFFRTVYSCWPWMSFSSSWRRTLDDPSESKGDSQWLFSPAQLADGFLHQHLPSQSSRLRNDCLCVHLPCRSHLRSHGP